MTLRMHLLFLCSFSALALLTSPARARERLIEGFEGLSGWDRASSPGAGFTLSEVPGKKGKALALLFDFTAAPGYVVSGRDVSVSLPDNYRFRFFVKGAGPENTIEFKVFDARGNVYWKKWHNHRFTGEWTELVARRRELVYAWGPAPGARLETVSRVELAVSCGEGGRGEASFDELVLEEIAGAAAKFTVTATASSSENGENVPARTVDGRGDTRWASAFSDNQWLQLDLGKKEVLAGLSIEWETAHAREYEILLSADGASWEKVFTETNGDGGSDDIYFRKRPARYVRINCLRRATSWGFSIHEVRLKGGADAILVSASSARGDGPADAMIDGMKTSVWRSDDTEAQRVVIDLQRSREYGGLFIHWGDDFAPEYAVSASNDGKRWNVLHRQARGNGGRDRVYVRDGESRYLKLELARSSAGRGYAIRELELKSPEEEVTRQKLYEALAEESPAGYYPKYFLNRQTYWTTVGAAGDEKESLVNEEGAFEVDKEQFSVEPFLFLDGKLLTWNDVALEQGLERDALPVPRVSWKHRDVTLTEKLFAVGEPGASRLIAWYRLANTSTVRREGRVYLAVRPFQVNPPWQCLGMQGGLARVETIEYDGDRVKVNADKYVIPLVRPDGFGAVSSAQGDIVAFLAEGKLPADAKAADAGGCASAALAYDFALEPGQEKHVYLAVPFHGDGNDLAPNRDERDAAELVARLFDETVSYWDKRLTAFTIDLPPEDMRIVNAMKSNLAYILINKDGPGIKPGSRSYNRSWIRDGAMTSSALLKMGLAPEVKEFAEWYARHIFGDGKVPCAVDSRGAEHCPENDSNGEFIYLCKQYYNYTKDASFLGSQLDNIVRAADYIIFLRGQRTTDEYRNGPDEKRMLYGLVPESISHEGYSAKPMHSYWDDFFALKGLKDAAAIMEVLGRGGLAEKYRREAEDFRGCIYDSVRLTMKLHAIDFIPGCAELGDFDATSTSIGVYPCDEFDYMPRAELLSTFERYYREVEKRFTPGTNWGENFTPYEVRNVRTFLYLNERDKAHRLLDFLLSTMRPSGWNHWAEVVWREYDTPKFIGDMPHTWVGSDYINSARGLFVLENENNGSLLVGKGVKASWLERPEGLSARGMLTAWGTLDLGIRKTGRRVTATLSGDLNVPGEIVLSSPLPEPIRSVLIDGKPWKDFTSTEVRFKDVPAEVVLSYE